MQDYTTWQRERVLGEGSLSASRHAGMERLHAGAGRTAKRGLDIAASLFLLVLLLPALAVIAMALAMESGWPVFFRQARGGIGGQPFMVVKFRTMRVLEDGPELAQATRGDARVTRLGAFLRRTSLDELPQLWNVLKGDMSLVGPRPHAPAQRSLYTDDEFAERCAVRPGITGLAQALLRSSGTEADRLALDLRYVREQSLALDLKIMGWTLKRLSGKDAN